MAEPRNLEELYSEIDDRINLLKELKKVCSKGTTIVSFLPSGYKPDRVMVTFELWAKPQDIDKAGSRHCVKMTKKMLKNTPTASFALCNTENPLAKMTLEEPKPEYGYPTGGYSIYGYTPKSEDSHCDECGGNL